MTAEVRENCEQLQMQLATNSGEVAKVRFLSPKAQTVQEHLRLRRSPLTVSESFTVEISRHYYCMIHLTRCRCLVQNKFHHRNACSSTVAKKGSLT